MHELSFLHSVYVDPNRSSPFLSMEIYWTLRTWNSQELKKVLSNWSSLMKHKEVSSVYTACGWDPDNSQFLSALTPFSVSLSSSMWSFFSQCTPANTCHAYMARLDGATRFGLIGWSRSISKLDAATRPRTTIRFIRGKVWSHLDYPHRV